MIAMMKNKRKGR